MIKFWSCLICGLAIFIVLAWFLAIAAGLLQYLIWIIIIGATIFGVAGFLLRPRGLALTKNTKPAFRVQREAEHALKQMEKQNAREKAR